MVVQFTLFQLMKNTWVWSSSEHYPNLLLHLLMKAQISTKGIQSEGSIVNLLQWVLVMATLCSSNEQHCIGQLHWRFIYSKNRTRDLT